VLPPVLLQGPLPVPQEQHPDYPISVAYLQQLQRCLATENATEKAAQEQVRPECKVTSNLGYSGLMPISATGSRCLLAHTPRGLPQLRLQLTMPDLA
jgi:hypothetical protein